MAENETTSHCFSANNTGNSNKQFEFENSNALLRTGVWDVKEEKCIELNDTKYLSEDSNNIDSVKLDIGEDASLALKSYHLQPPDTDGESREVTEAVVSSTSNKLLKDDPSNEHSVCSIELVSKSKVWEPKEEQYLESNEIKTIADESNSTNFVRYNRAKEGAEKSDHLELLITDGKINDLTEPVPGSSNGPVKEEPSDSHTVWLPSTTIKSEAEGNESKCKSEEDEESEDEVGEEERLEEESEAEMDDDSNGGAYHLAEVSYGDEDEETQKSEGQEGDSILGMSVDFKNPTSPRLDHCDDLSSLTSKEKLASDFIIRRKNFKVIDMKSGKVHYKNFECLICGYKAPQRSSLLDHIHKHTGEKIHHCLHCDKKFRYKSYLAQHITIHHTDFKAQFSCNLCGRRFAKESAFQRHERTHSGERPFPCNFCEYQARHRGALKEHLRIHTGEKPYTCDKCGYKCAYSTLLKRHYAKHHEEKTFACPSCNYVTKQLRNLNDHLKLHSGDKYYHCDKCSYKSIRKDSLKAHITHVHSNESLSCTVCKAKFKYTKGLNKHTYEHHPEKFPFKCELCNLRFKRPRGLALHNRKRHSEIVSSS